MLWHAGGAQFRGDSRQQFQFNRRIRVQDERLAIQWNMPDAIPSGNKVIVSRRIPRAYVRVMKDYIRVPKPRESYHLRGQVQPFDFETLCRQQIDEAPTASTAYVKSVPCSGRKLERPLVLRNPIGPIEFLTRPSLGYFIVTFRYFDWLHILSNVRDLLRHPVESGRL